MFNNKNRVVKFTKSNEAGKVGKPGAKPAPRIRPKRDSMGGPFRKRVCRFCKEKIDFVDYKDMKSIERFITDRGKILAKRTSGLCAKHQRKVSEAIKRARFLALFGYVKK